MPPAGMTRSVIALGLLPLLAACGDGGGTDNTPTIDLVLAPVASGLNFPTFLTAPPSDANRLFVVEKGGRVRIVRDGILQATPFLDLHTVVSTGNEQGLFSIAFDPAYATNRRVFTSWTGATGDTRIVRYTVSATNPDTVDPASADTVLSVAQPYANHNGGLIAFGPDGYLYVGLGDGGGTGDPNGNAQDLTTLLGKMLRLDVSGAGGYTIPADNPFVGGANRGEIWSYGLRNPWRWDFDPVTGEIYIGDVGQDSWEEVDVASADGRGLNYGWNAMEGTACYGAASCGQTGLALPVLVYGHDQGCSITGGYVYRGAAIPELQGTYFYADYCQGLVLSFRMSGGAATERTRWPALSPGGNVTSFGEDPAGELYVLTSDGRVGKIVRP